MPRTPSRFAPSALCLALLALASGCGPVDPIEPPLPVPFEPSGTLRFEVGTGEASYRSLDPGEHVSITFGPQGGEHIWFGARCQGAGSPAKVRYSIVDITGAFVSREKKLVLPAESDAEGWRSQAGITAVIDGSAPLVEGMKLFFRGHLEDDYGSVMDASSEAVLTGVGEGI
jgi:hypothetical protein